MRRFNAPGTAFRALSGAFAGHPAASRSWFSAGSDDPPEPSVQIDVVALDLARRLVFVEVERPAVVRDLQPPSPRRIVPRRLLSAPAPADGGSRVRTGGHAFTHSAPVQADRLRPSISKTYTTWPFASKMTRPNSESFTTIWARLAGTRSPASPAGRRDEAASFFIASGFLVSVVQQRAGAFLRLRGVVVTAATCDGEG